MHLRQQVLVILHSNIALPNTATRGITAAGHSSPVISAHHAHNGKHAIAPAELHHASRSMSSRLLSQQLQTAHLAALHVAAAQAKSHAQLDCTPLKLNLLCWCSELFCLPCNEQQPGSAKHERYIQSCRHQLLFAH